MPTTNGRWTSCFPTPPSITLINSPRGMESIRMKNEYMLDTLIAIATIIGFLMFVFSLISQPDAFPNSWFPSILAAVAFKVIFSAWIMAEIVNSFWSRKNSGAPSQDRGSFWIVSVAGFAVLFVVFMFRYSGYGSINPGLQYAGLILAVAGIALREWAIIILGKHFTVRVQVREKAKLVVDGPYKYIRHPSYTGSLLTYFGLPLAAGSTLGAV